MDDAPMTAVHIARGTSRDPVLAKVFRYTLQGWPEQAEDALKPYASRQLELSVQDGCLLWGERIVIPPQARKGVLIELHGGHPGASRMKSLARSLVWWPGMDMEIESMVKRCHDCQQCQPAPPAAPLQPWQWPTCSWSRLHVDFAGPLEGKMYLIVIDAHSKWLEVFPMTSATTFSTVQHLRQLFAQFGIPQTIVTDNGTQFTSTDFKQFCTSNGIHHIPVVPYHPSSNGLAERAVRIFKQGFHKITTGTTCDRISRFLLQYRITPHTTTSLSHGE